MSLKNQNIFFYNGTLNVPEGVGTGWNYNVGKAWLGSDIAFGEKIAALPPGLRKGISTKLANKELDKSFKLWASDVLNAPNNRGLVHTAGFFSFKQMDAIRASGLTVNTATITLTDARLRRMVRDVKIKNNIDLPRVVLEQLPFHLRNAQALLHDKRTKRIVFIINIPNKKAKIIVETDYKEKKIKGNANSIRSSSRVTQLNNLKAQSHYDVLLGDL